MSMYLRYMPNDLLYFNKNHWFKVEYQFIYFMFIILFLPTHRALSKKGKRLEYLSNLDFYGINLFTYKS